MSWESGHVVLDDLEALLARFVAFPSDARPRRRRAVDRPRARRRRVRVHTPAGAPLTGEGTGKTRTLEVLALVVPNPLHAVNISAAALYRLVADRQPTLLLDEADTYLGDHGREAARRPPRADQRRPPSRRDRLPRRGARQGRQGRRVPRLRSLRARRHRRPPRHDPRPLDHRPDETARTARDTSSRSASDSSEAEAEIAARPDRGHGPREHADELRDAWPDMPDGITDRAADVWEPLIAIADRAGGDWPDRARARRRRDQQRPARTRPQPRRPTPRRLPAHLHRPRSRQAHHRDARPGAHRPRRVTLGRPPRQADRRARRRPPAPKYDVRPGDHRFADGIPTGYRIEDFHDAWQRYLTPVAPVAHVAHPATGDKRPECCP